MAVSRHSSGTRVCGQAVLACVVDFDRRADRREPISASLDRIGVTAERFPAVDAHTASDEEFRPRVSP